nr:helix-turn-helix domain-containing protein [Paenibacillus turpanensis]
MIQYGGEIGLAIPIYPYVRVAIVEFPSHLHLNQHPRIEEMEQRFTSSCLAYGIEHMESNRYVFVIFTEMEFMEEADVGLQAFHQAISQSVKASVTIGVGAPTRLGNAPQSYLEAQTAIGYRFIQGINRVIYFDRIPLRPNGVDDYPVSGVEDLKRAIQAGSKESIQESVSLLILFIKEKQPPLLITRGLCFEMIRIMNGVWREAGLHDKVSDRYPDIFSLEQMETIDEFEYLMKEVSSDLYNAIANRQPALDKVEDASDVRSIQAMLGYIETNYDSCEFSLQAMSERFGMALPNLGQFFKERTGQTLLEYTTTLRMEKAKQLLITTQLPLKTVSEEVGYYNVSSFIRRFKQLTGMTPGEYRSTPMKSDAFRQGSSTTMLR